MEETGDFFPQKLFETYQYAAESGDCITYAGIPMYTGKTMQEMLKMNYEHFVLDFGSIEREQFAASLFFDERMQRVIVAGTSHRSGRTQSMCLQMHCVKMRRIFFRLLTYPM